MNDGFAKAREHDCESHQAIKAMLTTTHNYTKIEPSLKLPHCARLLFCSRELKIEIRLKSASVAMSHLR